MLLRAVIAATLGYMAAYEPLVSLVSYCKKITRLSSLNQITSALPDCCPSSDSIVASPLFINGSFGFLGLETLAHFLAVKVKNPFFFLLLLLRFTHNRYPTTLHSEYATAFVSLFCALYLNLHKILVETTNSRKPIPDIKRGPAGRPH